MQNTFLGENFTLPAFSEKALLGERIKNMTAEERTYLENDLAAMSAEAVYHIVSQMAVATRLPNLASAAVASRPVPTGFCFNHTLSMLNYVLVNQDEEEFDADQALLDAASLIKGYQHRTNMNLLEEVSSQVTKKSKALMAGNAGIDEAFVEHLGRALEKRLVFSKAEGMIAGLCELNLPQSLKCVLAAFKASEHVHLLHTTLQDLYTKDALNPAYIEVVRSVLGDQSLISLARTHLNDNSGQKSFVWLLEAFSEKTLLDHLTLGDHLEYSIKLKKPCFFFNSILRGNKELGLLQNTGNFVLDNLAVLVASEAFPPSDKLVEFAIEQGRGAELVSLYLDNIRAQITRMEDRVHAEDRFDSIGATPGQVLNEVLKNRYSIEAPEITRWRDATIRAVIKIGVLEFQTVLADMNEELATTLHKQIGNAPNRMEILEKCLKIRQVAFSHDLGL
jgi:hypothetical protein